MDLEWDKIEQFNQKQQASQAPAQTPAQPTTPSPVQHPEPEYYEDRTSDYEYHEDEYYDDEDYYEDDVSEVIGENTQGNSNASEALKRIEQAKLYELILNHEFFSPGSARQEIQDKVTSEIREFILDRLNVLVGLKQETPLPSASIEMPWDEYQMDALTSLANRLIEKRNPELVTHQPGIQKFTGATNEPSLNVAPPVQQPVQQQPVQQQLNTKPRRRRRKRPAGSLAQGRGIGTMTARPPPGVKLDPQTGHPISSSGIVLYQGQVPNRKAGSKAMPSQMQMNMLNQAQVQKQATGNSVADKMLSMAIADSQRLNASVIEE